MNIPTTEWGGFWTAVRSHDGCRNPPAAVLHNSNMITWSVSHTGRAHEPERNMRHPSTQGLRKAMYNTGSTCFPSFFFGCLFFCATRDSGSTSQVFAVHGSHRNPHLSAADRMTILKQFLGNNAVGSPADAQACQRSR